MTGKVCVVCQTPAQVFCHNDNAFLCNACDKHIHAANPLAERHHRVPLETVAAHPPLQAQSRVSVFDRESSRRSAQTAADGADAEVSVEDDGLFAVPDAFSLPTARDDSMSIFRSLIGKDFLSEDIDIFSLDPTWMDRLDAGVDKYPSDLLDSVVPDVRPSKMQKVAPQPVPKYDCVARSTAATEDMAAEKSGKANAALPRSCPASDDGSAAASESASQMSCPADSSGYHAAPSVVPQPVPLTLAQAQPCGPVTYSLDSAEMAFDVDAYVPRSLIPMEPSVRSQVLADRREKVDRFREKKKNRLFKKTIRYASRKAYAEVRPRIKGRFARKDEVVAMRAAGLMPTACA